MSLLPLSVQNLILERARNNVIVPGLTPKVSWEAVVSQGVTILSDVLNKHRVGNRLKELGPNIKRLLPKGGGVLVIVAYCNTVAATALKGQRIFLSADAVLGGLDAADTFSLWRKKNAGGTISAACPEGWSRTEDYLWITG